MLLCALGQSIDTIANKTLCNEPDAVTDLKVGCETDENRANRAQRQIDRTFYDHEIRDVPALASSNNS